MLGGLGSVYLWGGHFPAHHTPTKEYPLLLCGSVNPSCSEAWGRGRRLGSSKASVSEDSRMAQYRKNRRCSQSQRRWGQRTEGRTEGGQRAVGQGVTGFHVRLVVCGGGVITIADYPDTRLLQGSLPRIQMAKLS